MGRSRETIDAAVLATAIRIDARFEPDIRTLIARDDGLGVVAKILYRAPRLLLLIRIGIDNIAIGKIDMEILETIRRTPGSSATDNRCVALRPFFNDRTKFLLAACGHGTSSHEHITMSRSLRWIRPLRGRCQSKCGFAATF